LDDLHLIFPWTKSTKEALYSLKHQILSPLICGYPSCNNNRMFNNSVNVYSLGCSVDHAKKVKCLDTYGVEHHMHLTETKEKIKKTNIINYGCENHFNDRKIQNKIKETNQKNIGVDFPFQSKLIQQKVKNYFAKHHNVTNPQQVKSVKRKSEITNLKKFGFKTPLMHPKNVLLVF
jgi:hypothetical protein